LKKKGLFVGLTTIDLQFLVNTYPEPNTKIKAANYEINIGGPAANAAIAFSYLGGECHILSGIGNNHFSDFIKSEYEKFNIEITDITPNYKSDPTFATIITTDMTGDRTVFSYKPNNETNEFINLNKINLNNIDIVLIDGFHGNAAFEIAKKATELNIPVVYDGGSWKNRSSDILNYTKIAICSDDFYPPGCSDKQEVLKFLAEEKGIERVAITRGRDSIVYMKRDLKGKVEIYKPDVVDTLGAGDIFHGAFCYYYANNYSFEDSLKQASRIASESCKFFGTRSWMEGRNVDEKKH